MIRNFFLLIILFFLISCGGWDSFESAVSGQKKATTDEYLIKKKDPLILPPDYDKLPLPDSKKSDNSVKSEIGSILNEEGSASKNKRKKSPLEIRIEEELRKNN
mgnify:CR=1 FL=1|tara:strand:- start:151 stop:462 length:312 start_codon:yes stop_codon:yes gene_type:complete